MLSTLQRLPTFTPRCALVRMMSKKRRVPSPAPQGKADTHWMTMSEAPEDKPIITINGKEYDWNSIPAFTHKSVLTMLQQMKIPIESECGGKGECTQCTVHFDGVEGNSLACQTPAVAGMKLEVVPTKPQDTEPANLTEEVKEPGQIADFVIEQCEDWAGGSTDECLAVQYDLSGNARKFASALKEKLGMKRIGQLMGDKAFIHVDAKDLTDMDALIIAKMLRFHNAECEMLDINNNPRMGDLGVKAIAEHVLGRASNGHPLETLLVSGVNMTDEGLGYVTEALKTNNKLRLLEMRKNKLTDEGVVALAKVLKDDNSTLESLYLNANPGLTDISAEVLADAVAARKGKLKVILLDCENISFSARARATARCGKKMRF
ncbi:hypothetical protein FOL46_002495 [Perkinsus olseni]|uniref:2Fe-2S ferredoxin-type domain-containing protein n=1 Tax=Perkinsus olseni TaxID=32597 RepID=A0A7J6MUF7_PEROL|nr:hypothetical protein FOL46_002495 [Perkinsus olseni]